MPAFANDFSPCGVAAQLNNLTIDHTRLWVSGLGIQILRADYRGFFHERPSTSVGIFKLALDDTRLRFIADVPDNCDLGSQHLSPAVSLIGLMSEMRIFRQARMPHFERRSNTARRANPISTHSMELVRTSQTLKA
jgi:hypothetical protein